MKRTTRAAGSLPVALLLAFLAFLAFLAPPPSMAAGFADLEKQVKQFTLPNGLTVLVLERHDAPVFSFATYVDAGGVNEVAGITGVAHMFEHMAFKGTRTIGTTDVVVEAKALDAVDAAFDALFAEREKGEEADSTLLTTLGAAFKQAQDDARKLVVSNDFTKILEENGEVGLNAGTEMDGTMYYYSLPSNRLELWARLEGDRLTQPVLREFYTERDVVQEERRSQESSPMGRVFSTWWIASFLAHPYGNGLIGHVSDLKAITRHDAATFFREHYMAKNVTLAIVGDVEFAEVQRLVAKYFSGMSDAPKPGPVRTQEPRHEAEIRVTVEEDAQPMVLLGYQIPGITSKDWSAWECLTVIAGQGRSSRLYERLVKRDKTAVQAGSGSGFPGDKYPNLFLAQGIVARGASTDTVETAMRQELDRLAKDGPTTAELQKAKRLTRASFIRGLRANSGLANQLATSQGKQGDWRKLFGYLDGIDKVTTDDVRRVAAEAFREGNCSVGVLRKPA
jgi:predicted Zn-dependent peptidase